MATSSGASSGSTTASGLQNSGSEEDLQALLKDERKRKRMQSNRESARRSRMRKQKHLDDLTAQVSQLRNDNNQILAGMNITTHLYVNLEAENLILRAQMAELSHRLQSLNDIVTYVNSTTSCLLETSSEVTDPNGFEDVVCPWGSPFANQLPNMVAADMFIN